MRCSFCDTEGHSYLRVIPVVTGKRRAPSPNISADTKAAFGVGGACEACVAMIEASREKDV